MKRRTVLLILSLMSVSVLMFPQEATHLEPSERFVLVEAGAFQMGSDDGENDEKPIHHVTIGQPFHMCQYEVRVADFRRFVDDTGYVTTAERLGAVWIWTGSAFVRKPDANWRQPHFPFSDQDDYHPVVCVSWYDAVEYCNWLSRKEGLVPCYSVDDSINEVSPFVSCDFSANGYRLPTEAEWEYAARGGNKSRGYIYAGSNSIDDVAWYHGNSEAQTHPVGQKKPNELGLYDMSGNASEWCWDWFGIYSTSPLTDPRGPSGDSQRMIRGGSWLLEADFQRVAYRGAHFPPAATVFDFGFRLVRTAD
jgi:formylglycine-generating enzyme required for sulfatase activity